MQEIETLQTNHTWNDILDSPIKTSEITKAIKSLKTNKASSLDLVTNEMLLTAKMSCYRLWQNFSIESLRLAFSHYNGPKES